MNHENGFKKTEKNGDNGSGEINGNEVNGVINGKQNGEKEGEKEGEGGEREGEGKVEGENDREKGEKEGEKGEKGEKRDENENEDDDDEEEEEIEETPVQYSSPNPIFMEIKAGTKEQSILESLDQVTFVLLNFNFYCCFVLCLRSLTAVLILIIIPIYFDINWLILNNKKNIFNTAFIISFDKLTFIFFFIFIFILFLHSVLFLVILFF